MIHHAEDSSDDELWSACRRGDRTAFTVIYRRHSLSVLRFARSLVPDSSATEEILQEVFLTAWAKRTSIVVRGGSIMPWLLVTTRNFVRNARRRREKEARSLAGFDELVQRAVEPADLDGAIVMAEALDTLSALDRELCRLCLVEGYSYAAAAELLHLTESTLGKRLQRARERLRRAIAVKD